MPKAKLIDFRGTPMSYFRMERIKTLLPLIHRANDAEMTIRKAADWLGWSESCLRNWIRILGIRWRKRGPKRPRLDKSAWEARIIELRAKGKTHAQIAKELGDVGAHNISRFIKDNGIQIPNRNNGLLP